MKIGINWKFALLFFILGASLILLTGSFWMSIGILMLLFVADHFFAEFEDKMKEKKKKEKEEKN
jgi:protein-S-isoprenylcysteine O-methyltransferase Ste14